MDQSSLGQYHIIWDADDDQLENLPCVLLWEPCLLHAMQETFGDNEFISILETYVSQILVGWHGKDICQTVQKVFSHDCK